MPDDIQVPRALLRRLAEKVEHGIDHHPNSVIADLVREAQAALDRKPKMEDATFPLAEGMMLGSVAANGNLRVILDKRIAFELPNKWLHGETGLAEFIRQNCHPSGWSA